MEPLVGIVGAGPLGLELAIALKQTGIPYIQFDKGQVAQMIDNFPPCTQFFSSSERIGIAGIPVQTVDQQKCTREQYLAYIRSVVMHFKLDVHTYEEVFKIERLKSKGFRLHTRSSKGENQVQVRYLVLATGGTSTPRLLNVPGENLPHVSTKMEDPHHYFQKKVLIVGGRNSAVETALRLWNAGAKVCLVHNKEAADSKDVKYWLLPEMLGRIQRGEIDCFYQTEVVEILPGRVLLRTKGKDNLFAYEADFVIKCIGFEANMDLFQQLGIQLSPEHQAVQHDECMQVNIPNVYVLGTAVAGTQKKYRIFIENTHEHVDRIMASICEKCKIQEKWGRFAKKPYSTLEE